MNPAPEVRPYRDNKEHLADELRLLDLRIRLRTRTLALERQFAPENLTARSLYITPSEVEWLLATDTSAVASDATVRELQSSVAALSSDISGRVTRSLDEGIMLPLDELSRLFGLSPFETEALVICLAPELRRKYDRLYAYVQDDITRKRPSVDLVLELLCETEAQRWDAQRLFAGGAPLLYTGLLETIDDPHSPSGSTGLAQFLKLDPRICRFLLGDAAVDTRLSGHARLVRPCADDKSAVVDAVVAAGVLRLADYHLGPDALQRRKLVIYLHGPDGAAKRDVALNACGRLGCALLCVDADLLLRRGSDAQTLVRVAFREGLLQRACVYVDRAGALLQDAARPLLNDLARAVAEYGWLVFLDGEAGWTLDEPFSPFAFHRVSVPLPDVPLRAAAWERALAGRTSDPAAWASQLAAQFRLTNAQIESAVETAENGRHMRANIRELALADLTAACRQQSKHGLGELAVKVEPRYRWEDLVLPADTIVHLREVCGQVRHRYRVLHTWGFDAKLGLGKGLSVLFTGPPGTGKTMAAEVLAKDLEVDLYKVDLSGVVSKYIGETEKNLSRIFHQAETSNAILMFDEADALFGKRTEVKDAHDRYANIETSYLLQKMEAYDGVVILATNLRENMDDAFTRRIRFVVEFPFPDEKDRRRIWESHFPSQAPVGCDVDCAYLAREFNLTGGNIRNVALGAAFLAANDGDDIELRHVLQSTRREFEKLGRQWYGHRRPD